MQKKETGEVDIKGNTMNYSSDELKLLNSNEIKDLLYKIKLI